MVGAVVLDGYTPCFPTHIDTGDETAAAVADHQLGSGSGQSVVDQEEAGARFLRRFGASIDQREDRRQVSHSAHSGMLAGQVRDFQRIQSGGCAQRVQDRYDLVAGQLPAEVERGPSRCRHPEPVDLAAFSWRNDGAHSANSAWWLAVFGSGDLRRLVRIQPAGAMQSGR
ncbi:hypothetical protein ABZ942_20980 [Nocardia sp. NPDC046473]|uniref:hypothetical protein n=1 Tax=Nocardia sp. NPDC046473 TaxID=3155733 RepID=UPI00340B7169